MAHRQKNRDSFDLHAQTDSAIIDTEIGTRANRPGLTFQIPQSLVGQPGYQVDRGR